VVKPQETKRKSGGTECHFQGGALETDIKEGEKTKKKKKKRKRIGLYGRQTLGWGVGGCQKENVVTKKRGGEKETHPGRKKRY